MAPLVRFLPSQRSLVVPPGTTLLEAARAAGLPMASGCGADGLCGRCVVRILRGAERLHPESDLERRGKRRNRVSGELRLACRVTPTDEVEITTPYW
jgi:ferredoxin